MRALRVSRTGRYAVLGRPAAAAELWVVLHGYGQLAAGFIRRFSSLPGIGEGRAVVAPEALSRFYVESSVGEHGPGSRVGASWMTREARLDEIGDYVGYLDAVVADALGPDGGAGPELVILGFSQGAETASRWAAYGRHRARELVLWGGGPAADLDMGRAAAALRDTTVTFVVGDQDGWAARRSVEGIERLGAAGIEAVRVDYAGGHRVEAAVLVERWR